MEGKSCTALSEGAPAFFSHFVFSFARSAIHMTNFKNAYSTDFLTPFVRFAPLENTSLLVQITQTNEAGAAPKYHNEWQLKMDVSW